MIIGSEHELFGAFIEDGVVKGAFPAAGDSFDAYAGIMAELLTGNYGAFGESPNFLPSFGFYTANGFRLYRDVEHLEISSPECARARDLLKWEKAGERIIASLLAAVNEKTHPNLLAFYKKNCDFGDHSFAAHESYQFSGFFPPEGDDSNYSGNSISSMAWEKHLAPVLPFFASSAVVTGAGHFDAKARRYLLSPRGAITKGIVSNNTMQIKVMFLARSDSDMLNPLAHRRLQVVCRDSNMADWSIYLKFGTTGLVFRMLEAGFFNHPRKRLAFGDKERYVTEALNALSSDATKKHKTTLCYLDKPVQMKAAEIQEKYLEWAEEFIGKNGGTSEEKDVLEKWRFVVWALKNDEEALEDKLDYKIKEKILRRYLSRYSLTLESYRGSDKREILERELQLRDLLYHDLGGSPLGLRYLASKGAVETIATAKEIGFADANAPPNTRAAWREAMLKEIRRLKLKTSVITWSRIEILFREKTSESRAIIFPLTCLSAAGGVAAIREGLGVLKILASK